jgi:cell division protein FtsW
VSVELARQQGWLLARLRARNTRELEQSSRSWPKVTGPADAVLTGAIVALTAFGVVMVYSASAVFAHSRYEDPQHFLLRQAIFAGVGVPLMVLLARFDYHRLRALTYPFLAAAVLLLGATAFGLGRSAGGASRWIDLGPINVQPAEIVKIAMICWLAYSLSKKSERIRTFSVGFLPHVLMAAALMMLCLKQPDFGSAVMIALITFVLLLMAIVVAHMRWRVAPLRARSATEAP